MSSAARTPARARRGVTLLELLLVMAILGVALGAGVGLFATLDLGKSQARGLVKNVLRTAQNSATVRQAPARVRFDVERQRMVAESMQVVGTWHFEGGAVAGVSGMDGALSGGTRFVEDGFLGEALELDGTRGTYAEIPIQHDPAFDFRDGFSVSCALRRAGRAGGQAIAVSDIAGLDVGADGRLRGWFVPLVFQDGSERPGGRVLVETAPGVLRTGEWTRVKLEYDRATLRILVDGVPLAEHRETAPVWKIERPLFVSGTQHPFAGSVDSLVVACVIASEEIPMPDTVRLGGDTPAEVRFAAGGGLDRDHHPEPLILTLEYDDGSREQLFVGTFGTVDG